MRTVTVTHLETAGNILVILVFWDSVRSRYQLHLVSSNHFPGSSHNYIYIVLFALYVAVKLAV